MYRTRRGGCRQDRDDQNENAHTADPMRETSPEKQPAAHRFDVVQNRCSRCRKSADRLKKRVDERLYLAADDERRGADKRHRQPCERNDDETFFRVYDLVFRTAERLYNASEEPCSDDRARERPNGVFFLIYDRHDERQEHQPRFEKNDLSEQG